MVRDDPLALDPLGPIGIDPLEDESATSADPLELDPLSPIPAARPLDHQEEMS